MAQYAEFAANHWLLFIALVIILVLLIYTETATGAPGSHQLSCQAAVLKINHEQAIVLDIREKSAFKQSHIIDSINISAEQLKTKKEYQDKPIILVCDSGTRAANLANELRKQGFAKVMFIKGGLNAWQEAELPLTQK